MADSGGQACCGSLFFIVFGIALLYSGTQRFLLRQRIMNTPTSKVRSAAVGLVELFGKADFEGDMLSPVSKAKCAYWRVTGEYYYHSRRSSGWRQFYQADSAKQFHLVDDTGRMLVDAKGAEVLIPQDFQCTGHLSDKAFFGMLPQHQLDKRVLGYVNSGESIRKAFAAHSGTNLRFTEYFIAEGDPLYVLGSAQPREGASSAVAHENLVVRKAQGPGQDVMYISDSAEKKVVDKMLWDVALWAGLGAVIFVIGMMAMLGSLGFLLISS